MEPVYVVREHVRGGEYLTPSGGRSPAANEAREFTDRDEAESARERDTDRVYLRTDDGPDVPAAAANVANLSAANVAKLERLTWHTPPRCQGQIVEVSYAAVADGAGEGWILQRTHDRSDGATTYAAREWATDDGADFWQQEPGGAFLPVEDGDSVLRHC